MSDDKPGIPNPPPQPLTPSVIVPKVDWLHLLLAVLSAVLFGAQLSAPSVVAPNVPPSPHVLPDVQPVVPDNKPDSKPDSVVPVPDDHVTPPVPDPKHDRPVACITITDSTGQKVDSVCGAAQQLVISSDQSIHGCHPDSIVWSVKPDVQKTLSRDGTSLVITTPFVYTELTIQQIVALNDKVASATVLLKSGTPNVNPNVNPSPVPGPIPGPVNPTPLPPTPLPTLPVGEFGGLPAAVLGLAGQVVSANKVAEAGKLADAFEALGAQIAAGALKTPVEIVAAVGAQFDAVSSPAWDAVFRVKAVAKMKSLYQDGKLPTPDRWRAMLMEAAMGLRAVK